MVLIVGFTVAVAGSIVVVGSVVLSDVQQAAQTTQAEQAMTQLDSRASTVALGESATQTVRLGHTDSGQVSVDTDAGQITIEAVNETATQTIASETFGAVIYESGRERIGFQGGGVWRARGDGSVMVSAPEYHYRGRTLTFPIVRVTGEEWSGSPNVPITVTAEGSDQLFPTATRKNPLEEGHVHVEVESEFHRGWKAFFETRTEGTVTHDPANRTVSVNLTTPYREGFENSVAATSNDSDAIEQNGGGNKGGFDSPTATGVDRPSASPRVERRIDDCESGGCTALSTAGSTLENGTYYRNGDETLGATTYNTSEGDIHVVVDGDLEFAGSGGPPGTAHHEITGDGRVFFYVNGSLEVGGSTGVNTGGDASDLVVMIHTDGGDVTLNGNPQYTGLLYAPNASLVVNGGGNQDNIVGGVVVREATSNGNGNVVHSNPDGFRVEFDPIDSITFLHVSENRVSVGA